MRPSWRRSSAPSSCRGCVRARSSINTVRLSGVSADESIRYGTQIERVLLDKFPDEIEHVWSAHRDAGGGDRSDGPRALRRVHHAHAARASGSAPQRRTSSCKPWRRSSPGMPGMRVGVHAAHRDARQRDGGRDPRRSRREAVRRRPRHARRQKAREIEAALEEDPAAPRTSRPSRSQGQPVLEIEVDRAAIARHGIAASDVLDVVEAARHASRWGSCRRASAASRSRCASTTSYREDPATVGRILVTAPGGERVPLARLAKIRTVEGPATHQPRVGQAARSWCRRTCAAATWAASCEEAHGRDRAAR